MQERLGRARMAAFTMIRSDDTGTFRAEHAYSKTLGAGTLPTFDIAESDLGMGASLGNSALWLHTKGTGAIGSLFLNEAGLALAGTVSLRYGAHAVPLMGSAVPDERTSYAGLYPEPGTRRFHIHPAYQRVGFTLANVIAVEETTFLPLGEAPGRQDLPIVYIMVAVTNTDSRIHHVRAIASAMLRGESPADVRARYDERANALVAWNESSPAHVRVFGISGAPTRYGCDFNVAAAYDPAHVHALNDTADLCGDLNARLQLDLSLAPGECREFAVAVGLYNCGDERAVAQFCARPEAGAALRSTIAHLEDVTSRAHVLTPDAVINHGALWSKVNMRRVMAAYPSGPAFTNDPGKYANVVVRDCAWFVYGNDHFLPEFSRSLLDNIASRQYENGKLPEYFDAVAGRVEDDGLNINDDTPLYILAVNHHFRATGDRGWLQSTYPSVARAARYILSQIDERGLVFCRADDPRGNVWAIAGWRNIIEGYSINGAVTEINAECVAALRAAAHLAEDLQLSGADREDFASGWQRVRAAMDEHLINPDNGMYYLNIDVHGDAHSDVTGDQIFPVIMRACSDEVAFRIISRLNFPDFWTTAGLRTVSREDPRFDPSACSGLLGGVWPGLTWWYAFGAARYHASVMVRALRSSFEHYGSDPKRNNTVPGQFSEWFDGESLANHGMRLSPWEPPRFLWAAVEGVCGVMLSPNAPSINPLIPSGWRWVGLRNLPYHGEYLTYFLARERDGFRVYATHAVDSAGPVEVYERDISAGVRVFADGAAVIALTRADQSVILVGNAGEQTMHAPLVLHPDLLEAKTVRLRTYNSELHAWTDEGEVPASRLHALAVTIEAGGYRLIEVNPAG